MKPSLPPFPQSQFPSWCFICVTEILFLGDILKICPCCPPHNCDSTPTHKWLLRHLFWPSFSPLQLKPTFTVPSQVCFLFTSTLYPLWRLLPIPNSSSLKLPVLSLLSFPNPAGNLPFSLHSLDVSMTQHNKEAGENVPWIVFLNTIISNFYLVFFKMCPPLQCVFISYMPQSA